MSSKKNIIDVKLDTMIHKRLVFEMSCKMAVFFLSQGEDEKAVEILQRGWEHDNSKFLKEELEGLAKISDDHASMRHAGKQLPDEMKEYLKLHYKNNTHHPEHWEDVSMMPEMDVVEMCCDWAARSKQFDTDLIEFAKTRQENRFHFPPEMFERILFYCTILS